MSPDDGSERLDTDEAIDGGDRRLPLHDCEVRAAAEEHDGASYPVGAGASLGPIMARRPPAGSSSRGKTNLHHRRQYSSRGSSASASASTCAPSPIPILALATLLSLSVASVLAVPAHAAAAAHRVSHHEGTRKRGSSSSTPPPFRFFPQTPKHRQAQVSNTDLFQPEARNNDVTWDDYIAEVTRTIEPFSVTLSPTPTELGDAEAETVREAVRVVMMEEMKRSMADDGITVDLELGEIREVRYEAGRDERRTLAAAGTSGVRGGRLPQQRQRRRSIVLPMPFRNNIDKAHDVDESTRRQLEPSKTILGFDSSDVTYKIDVLSDAGGSYTPPTDEDLSEELSEIVESPALIQQIKSLDNSANNGPLQQLATATADLEYDPDATSAPTANPTSNPTSSPTDVPTPSPTPSPTTATPTAKPTTNPTVTPGNPTKSPTVKPTASPTAKPTTNPTVTPGDPTASPTANPTASPTTASPTIDSAVPPEMFDGTGTGTGGIVVGPDGEGEVQELVVNKAVEQDNGNTKSNRLIVVAASVVVALSVVLVAILLVLRRRQRSRKEWGADDSSARGGGEEINNDLTFDAERSFEIDGGGEVVVGEHMLKVGDVCAQPAFPLPKDGSKGGNNDRASSRSSSGNSIGDEEDSLSAASFGDPSSKSSSSYYDDDDSLFSAEGGPSVNSLGHSIQSHGDSQSGGSVDHLSPSDLTAVNAMAKAGERGGGAHPSGNPWLRRGSKGGKKNKSSSANGGGTTPTIRKCESFEIHKNVEGIGLRKDMLCSAESGMDYNDGKSWTRTRNESDLQIREAEFS